MNDHESAHQTPHQTPQSGAESHLCPKCDNVMEKGYVLDYVQPTVVVSGQWIEGEPEPSPLGGLRTRDKRQRPVRAWRCTRCGFLEFYAR